MKYKTARENDSYSKASVKSKVQQDMAKLQRERHHKESVMQLGKMRNRVNKIVENAMDFLKRIS